MKIKKLAILLPVIALSACASLGKEINEEEAVQKAYAIDRTISESKKEVETFIEISASKGSGDTKETQHLIRSFVRNSKGEMHYKAEENYYIYGKTYNVSVDYYYVLDEKYGQVVYLDNYRSNNQGDCYQIAYVGDEAKASHVSIIEDVYFTSYLNNSFESASLTVAVYNMPEDNVVRKFYSTGNGNLTVQVKDSSGSNYMPNTTPFVEKTDLESAEATITFDGGLFKNATIKADYKDGNKAVKVVKKYKDHYTFSLPKNWEKTIKEHFDPRA